MVRSSKESSEAERCHKRIPGSPIAASSPLACLPSAPLMTILISISQWNKPAIAFYEQRLGAKPLSDLTKERLQGKAAIRRLAALAD